MNFKGMVFAFKSLEANDCRRGKINMTLSAQSQIILSQLNVALIQQDEHRLESLLSQCDLQEILNQDTVAQARARGKNRLVVFLNTLAVHNEVQAEKAQYWLRSEEHTSELQSH